MPWGRGSPAHGTQLGDLGSSPVLPDPDLTLPQPLHRQRPVSGETTLISSIPWSFGTLEEKCPSEMLRRPSQGLPGPFHTTLYFE